MVSMIPFGLLSGFAGDQEIRITKLDETGFGFRLCKENQMMASGNTKAGKDKTKTGPQQLFRLCFYDLEKGEYNEVKISFYDLKKETDEPSEFYEKFWVFVNQPDYKQAVQSLLRQYNRYIHLKLEEDDSGLAKNMTGYPGELDQVRCESLEAQMQIWDEEVQAVVSEATSDGKEIWKKLNAELALELDHTEMYADYLRLSFAEFLKKYAENSIGICKKLLQSERKPKWLYIGNQFCHLLFPERKLLFEIIEKELQKENIEFLKLTGQTKVSERINLVDEFNSNPNKKLFLISLKAGGTGLNLIGADMVIHYDPWWNISTENQATDRAYRIGQKNNVQVYKLITKNSIEEKIYDILKKYHKDEDYNLNYLITDDIVTFFLSINEGNLVTMEDLYKISGILNAKIKDMVLVNQEYRFSFEMEK